MKILKGSAPIGQAMDFEANSLTDEVQYQGGKFKLQTD
jgi:hypothetical protein